MSGGRISSNGLTVLGAMSLLFWLRIKVSFLLQDYTYLCLT